MDRFTLTVLCFSTFYCSQGTQGYEVDDKIVGGTEAVPNSVKFMVSVQFKLDGFHFCGGSIVNERNVVTSGHCCQTVTPEEIQIVAGEHSLSEVSGNEQVCPVRELLLHEKYNAFDFENDICLLVLDKNIVYNDLVNRASIATDDSSLKLTASVYGWGATSNEAMANSEVLMKVDVPILKNEDCAQSYGNGVIHDFMLCAGADGKDSCKRDTGSPLVCQNAVDEQVLCGTASFGYDCGQPGFPGVYMRISSFSEWINENIQ
ncbi:trypsin-1-like [Tigriopus californicus]|uniref:trypsin-1-like n=1 Tax=Tigriopus californicus TaxID=6832 RepID=UPI0027DA4A52|nr:trypsin-1-like [Tigriopus californicus]|eukprot:TCALIF_02564-PA protein Name:"Similar to Trypsin-1 (Astacus astacus)" AED:0.14 eAED:0.14 QI:17/1/0.71/1/1/1/7/76/260